MDVTKALLGVIGICLATALLSLFLRKRKHMQLLKRYNIPGPKPHLITGNLDLLFNGKNNYPTITALHEKYGDVMGYYLGHIPFVSIKDVDLLKQIFIKDFNIFANRPEPFVNFGLTAHSIFGLKDKKWKEIRSIISPMFTSGKLKLLNNMVTTKVDYTITLIEEKVKAREMFDIYALMQGLTLDVIGAAALALKMNCQQDQDDDILTALKLMFKSDHSKLLEVLWSFPFVLKFQELFLEYSVFGKYQTFVGDHVKSVVKERCQDDKLRGSDFLQVLIDKCKDSDNDGTLTLKEVIANGFGLFGAGYETTSTTLGFTFYLLAKYPEIQQRLYEEIRDADDESYETIQGLQYLDQVYSEALRLYPPVTGFIARNATQDYQTGSYTIPKGCEIVAPVWDIHHDPNFWPDPWKYDPDRFSPENKSSINSMAYIPFGIGPRNCVGIRMALMESKTAIFKLMKRVKLETCMKSEDSLELNNITHFCFPANGVWVTARLRSEE